MSAFEPHPISNGIEMIGGRNYMRDGKGGLVPLELIKAQDLLQDETVRKIAGFALAISGQMGRFKEHTFTDIGDFEAVLAQEYDATLGGKKGNMTLMSVDRLFKVQVAVSDRLAFGPELHIARQLFNDCLNEWSSEARAEVRGLITDAFNTDKEGTVNRQLIFVLLRRESDDPRWRRAQDAIRDAIRVESSTTYVRVYHRAHWNEPWQQVPLSISQV